MTANRLHPGVRKTRSTVQARLRIRVGPQEWWAEVADLSMSGVRVASPAGLTLDAGQSVEIEVLCADGPAVALDGICVRAGQGELAFSFPAVDPAQESELRCVIRRCGNRYERGE